MNAEGERGEVRRVRALRELAESRVVAVRLDGHLANRLDDLCDRTGRKRSYYLKEAVERMLPYLEAKYWAHDIEDAQRDEDRQFADLIRSLTRPDSEQHEHDGGHGHH